MAIFEKIFLMYTTYTASHFFKNTQFSLGVLSLTDAISAKI